jgi:hypothetical protein
METILATPERYAATLEKMKAKGIPISNKITYESMRQFINSGDYEIQISQNWYIKIILDMVETILTLLMHRKWSLIIAKNDAGHFICSDMPVALIWTKPMPAIYGPGFGMTDTELTIPLNKEIALIARFEGQEQIYEADRQFVASLNSRTGMYADRFLYSPDEKFSWIRSDEVICTGSDLIEAIHVQKGK